MMALITSVRVEVCHIAEPPLDIPQTGGGAALPADLNALGLGGWARVGYFMYAYSAQVYRLKVLVGPTWLDHEGPTKCRAAASHTGQLRMIVVGRMSGRTARSKCGRMYSIMVALITSDCGFPVVGRMDARGAGVERGDGLYLGVHEHEVAVGQQRGQGQRAVPAAAGADDDERVHQHDWSQSMP